MKAIRSYSVLLFLLTGQIVFVACNTKEKKTVKVEHAEEVYTCPMHPEIIRNKPGSCPICGMDLVKKETGSMQVRDVELDALLKPSNAFVISTVPVTGMVQREEHSEQSVVGTVAFDTRQSGAISSFVSGRIERLYIRYKYQPVSKGQHIMDIYSPELMTAQQNLIFLLRNDATNTSLVNAAKERLILMGMTKAQVSQLVNSRKPVYAVPVYSRFSGFVTNINNPSVNAADGMQPVVSSGQALSVKEGMYVQSGQAVFKVYNLSRAWVLLDIYPEQQVSVKKGDAVRIIPETAPQKDFRARIDYIEPIFRPGSKTLTARVYFDNARLRLPVGSRVTANIFSKPVKAWWLPKEAVLSLGRDKIVFKKEQKGFRPAKINTGVEFEHFIQVSSGLAYNDSVAINAQYLVDNEAFIKINGNE